jgi:hypothetical protein
VFARSEPSKLQAVPVVRLRQWTTAVDSARLTGHSETVPLARAETRNR